ncbi:hypothetical protein GCM10011348_38500 [Marinobacterium nitratireducens]|uniref:Uncharacterized protein n=1 Tax=Marinobacterium nitratireducens TaxID=518897 RepID=A0A917ZLX2_9GAMM|nr:hypothetical protein [Marinobacterium nitratireducens]GGO86791.1 hypothetical protein GCM10011348_38500 [Marinobacterium nitratireducens]
MQTDAIQSRIENLTAGLTPAVQAGQGAQFSLLLSLISVNQQQYTPAQPPPAQGAVEPAPEPRYPDPRSFYTEAFTERLNRSLRQSQPGEFALLCSYLDVAASIPRQTQRALDRFEQVALMSSGRLMLDRIEASRLQLSA